jgi:hypothetical protein
MTLFLPPWAVSTDDQAMEVCDQIATLCDQLLGRPSSGESKLTYVLTSEVDEDEDDDDAQDRWMQENLFHPRVRGVIIPRPVGELQ